MRHEQIADKASYAKVEFPAAWPAAARIAPAPVPEEADAAHREFVVTPSCPDVPAAAGGLIAASYVGLIATFAVAMTGSAQSVFAIVICGLFLAAFFAVPRLFLGLEPTTQRRPSLERFLHEGMATMTGGCSGRDGDGCSTSFTVSTTAMSSSACTTSGSRRSGRFTPTSSAKSH